MSQPTFQLRTVDGQTYTPGDVNTLPFGAPDAVLEAYRETGDYIELEYTHGLTVSIPEHRIDYLAEIGV